LKLLLTVIEFFGQLFIRMLLHISLHHIDWECKRFGQVRIPSSVRGWPTGSNQGNASRHGVRIEFCPAMEDFFRLFSVPIHEIDNYDYQKGNWETFESGMGGRMVAVVVVFSAMV
jgi:hypothetical protein